MSRAYLLMHAGERRAEAAQVRAALVRVDVVGEREDRLLVGGVPLHRDLDRALVGLALEGDHLAVDRLLVLVEVGDEVGDAALVVERRRWWPSPRSSTIEMRRSRVRNAVSRSRSSSVLKSKSSVSKMSASGRNVIVVPCSSVGSPRVIGPDRDAALVALGPDVAVAADLGVEPLRQRVDDRHADAVQAAGDLVAAALAELAAGVQHGQHDLERRLALLLHGRDRDAGAVVDDGDRVVRMDRHLDGVVTARRAPRQQSCQQPRRRGGEGRACPVEPMYMPGRLRTASRPSSTWMFSAS